MNNNHRLITALVATVALLIGSVISSSAVAQTRPTLQSLQNQVDNTYTKEQVDAIVAKIIPAAVPRTGQTLCYNSSGTQINCPNTGQDGDKLAGVAAPTPRFVDNGNGTVTDKLTGLIWLKDANCFGLRDWQTALNDANGLASGSCGLTDGSTAGQWRLPNVNELHSLINYGYSNPALSNAAGTGQWTEGDAFSGVQSANYWSSSSYVGPGAAWNVFLDVGRVIVVGKAVTIYVWPVRGGQ